VPTTPCIISVMQWWWHENENLHHLLLGNQVALL